MKIRSSKGLTFDDVLLVPKRSPVASRQNVDTSTWLTPQVSLQVPIISANMDTVTETAMAIAMARTGGIGIIHRFMSIERQADQVRQVKRAQGFIVENPYSILDSDSVEQAGKMMDRYNVGGLVVLDAGGKMVGLITQRDILLAPDELTLVNQLMTPLKDVISAPADVTPERARSILYQHRIEKLPVMDKDGTLRGLITARDVMKAERYPQATKDGEGTPACGWRDWGFGP